MGRTYRTTPYWVLASCAVCLPGCSKTLAQTKSESPSRTVELVVYSDDFAMVQESRQVSVEKGTQRIAIQDVSQKMDQDSVVYNWPDTKEAKIRSSTYELGTQDSGQLLQRFLGREVDLVYRAEDGREGERRRGILQVAEPGNFVVKVGDKLVVNPNATIEAPANAGVVTIPQLSAEVESSANLETRLGVAYLTRGISWSADYTATLHPGADTMTLECWGTVVNKTGTDFPNAQLTFVAGSPNRAVRDPGRYRMVGEMGGFTADKSKGPLTNTYDDLSFQSNSRFQAPERAGELYAYPYKVAASIRPDQLNRVRMMGGEKVQVVRDYAIRMSGFDSYNFYQRPEQRLKATLSLKLKNSKSGGLGLPLPAGALRVYEPSSNGSVRYIGASTLANTPTDADINATLTEVFDVYAQSKLVSTKKVNRKSVARVIEVALHNEKDTDVQVRLVQDFWGKWKIAHESAKSKKLNANTNEWKITLPKASTVKLTYTVHLG